MFIKRQRKSARGYTLVEMIVAFGVFGIVTVAICSIYLFSTRSFAALANYAELDKINRTALDTMTKEIRQAKVVTAASTNSITFINGDGLSVTYYFDPTTEQLVRSASDGSSRVLLSSCDLLTFHLGQRNLTNGTFDAYPPVTGDWSSSVKVVRLSWKATRPIPGAANHSVSETIQTAQVVIRKQHAN
jgi:Tfp pilus assembly protein PilW